MRYRFGEFELDTRAGELRRSGETVSIQPKPFALLTLLVEERARVVPLEELTEALWPDTVVSPASLNRAVSHARRAIDDAGRGESIRSIPRRGYRFTAEVERLDPHPQSESGRATPAAPEADSPAAPAGHSQVSHFVGREAACDHLASILESARAGRTALVLCEGPPGIGKTRLTEVLVAKAREAGFQAVTAGCRDRDGAPVFWLWTQIFRRASEVPEYRDEVVRRIESGELEALLPAIELYLPELAPGRKSDRPPAAVEPRDQQRFLFFEAAALALSASARRTPLLLVLEDLQWAGEPSLRMLEHFASEVTGAPLMILATVRDESRPRNHPVDRTLEGLRRLGHVSEITLTGLSRAEVGAFLAHSIGGPAPSELISELYARTSGIPLFVVEATRLLAERGDLAHPERIPRHGITLPAKSLDLIGRALTSLSKPTLDLLEIGAALGRELPLPLLASVAGIDRATALERLDEAIGSGAVEASENSTAVFRFSHALFQEALYDGLAPAARARHHLAIAERLESRHAGDEESILSELAHHHHCALAIGDPERCYAFAVRAAEAAERLFAFEEVAGHYERALDALGHAERIDPARRLETLLLLGEAHVHSGNRMRRLDVLHDAIGIARSLDDSKAFIRAAIGFCSLAEWSSPDPRAYDLIEEALERAETDDWLARARLTTRQAYLRVQEREAAEPIIRDAIVLAKKSEDPETIQESLYILHYILGGPDDLEERGRVIETLLEAADRSTNRETAVIAALDLACDRLMLGDRKGALDYRARAARIPIAQPSASTRWHLAVWDAGLALLEGRLESAEQQANDALLLGRRIAHPFAKACFNGQMATLDRERGDPQAVIDRIGGAIHNARVGATHWTRAVVGRAACATGDMERGRSLLEEVVSKDLSGIVRNLRWNGTILEIAHLCADSQATDHARNMLEALATAEGQHALLPIPISYGGPLAYAAGRLHALLGELEAAKAILGSALEDALALGARPTHLRIALEIRTLDRAAGGSTAVLPPVSEIESEARRLGMKRLAEAAAALDRA